MSAPEVAQATLEGALDLLAALDLGIEVVLRGLGQVPEGGVDDQVTRLGCGRLRRVDVRALARGGVGVIRLSPDLPGLARVGLGRLAVLVDVLAHALPAVEAVEPVEEDGAFFVEAFVVEAFFAGDFLAVDVVAVDFFAVVFVAVDAFFAGAFVADDDEDADFLSAERAGRREGAGAIPGATSATVAPAVSAIVATPTGGPVPPETPM